MSFVGKDAAKPYYFHIVGFLRKNRSLAAKCSPQFDDNFVLNRVQQKQLLISLWNGLKRHGFPEHSTKLKIER